VRSKTLGVRIAIVVVLLGASIRGTCAISEWSAPENCPQVMGGLKDPYASRLAHPVAPFGPNVAAITLRIDDTEPARRYSVHDADGATVYVGGDIAALAKSLHDRGVGGVTLYVLAEGTSARRRSALYSSLETQLGQLPKGPDVLFVQRLDNALADADDVDAQDVELHSTFLEPAAISVESVTEAGQVHDGRWRGWFKTLVKLTLTAATGVRQITLAIYTQSAELATNVAAIFSRPNLSRLVTANHTSVAVVVAAVRREIRRQNPSMSAADVAVELRVQFGKNYLVLLRRKTQRAAA